MTAVRVIATDLDKTLLGAGGCFSDRSRAALGAARDCGITVVAVTARPPRVFEVWTGLAASIDLAICANGTMVYNPTDRSSIMLHTMAPEIAEAAAKALRAALPGVRFAVETGLEVFAEPGYAKVDSVLDRTTFATSLGAVLGSAPPFVKLHAHIAGGSATDLLYIARKLELEGVEVWETGSVDLLELGPAGVSKARTLAAWCTEAGIGPEQVVAFGDAPTDGAMLAWAGRSFAVADAHPAAARAATDRCGASGEDGVAAVIEALLATGQPGAGDDSLGAR
ncbi:HAD family hydrolase [Glycomyces harbinensis]|uniref:Hydroxymethylpyrimidine pyrophosphatase n=1 Tax=Glycomyces harbinensis TaxID=58114 RepID=A0A1G6QV69_9ACTN|nr:HAD family hydrolase [Glycomyces harbinensis]SDC95804.1 hypothetical protein SAMN05216270_101112 [Glycomyces harbinensis]